MRELEDAKHIVSGLARVSVPSPSHAEIADLR